MAAAPNYIPIIVTILIIGILLIILVTQYNKLNKTRNQISNAESSLDALFIKRHDLIPNLITVIKQNMEYEKGVLEKISELRSKNDNPQEYKEDNELSTAFKSLMVQVENYPVLKANEQFSRLYQKWSEIEEQISAGRRYISSSITCYNDAVKIFPSNIVASMFGFKPYKWERATIEQKKELDAKNLFD